MKYFTAKKKKGGGLFVAMETQKRHVLDNDLKADAAQLTTQWIYVIISF